MNLNLSIDIDEKINLIYNFNYEESGKSCFKIGTIDLNNITLDDIKISNNNEIKEDLYNQIIKGNFQLLNFNEKTKISLFKRFSDNFSTSIYISPYIKTKNTDNINNENNVDSLFSYVLSKLLLDGKTKHILLPIINIDLTFSELNVILKSYPLYKIYNKLIIEDKISSIFSIRIRENFFSSVNLREYININKKINYKYILFQLIHTLATIQKEYPDFVHNNLRLENIIIQTNNLSSNTKYKFDNKLFEIKNNNIFIKISSFNKSECTSILKSTNKSKNNKYTDLWFFLNKLYKYNNFSNTDSETFEFLTKILPKKYIGSANVEELFKPKDLLNDKYFKSLEIVNNIIEKKSSNQKYMKNHSENSINNKYNINQTFMTNLESDSKSILGHQSEVFSERKLKRVEVKKKSKKLSRKIKTVQRGGMDNKIERKDINDTKIFTRKIKETNQVGGYRDTTNPYKKEKNNPYLTNDARNTYSKKKEENPYQPKEPPVLAEQKIYDLNKMSKPQQPYIPTEVAAYNPFYAQSHPLYPYEAKTNPVHVVKPVNISFSNPVGGSHNTINRVYEDMLPGDRHTFSLRSIFERKQLLNFLRNMILENGDGEEISISAGKKKSLLSYIRLLEVNPFNIERNPYKSLSKGFLLYSSAYPIRYEKDKDYLGIAKDSMGINVRIYEMSIGAKRCYSLNRNIDCDDFEVWRDIKYYEYVREDIIKKKISPNFVCLYMYTIDSESRINYRQLDEIKYEKYPKGLNGLEIKNNSLVNKNHNLDPLQFMMLDSFGVKPKSTQVTNYITNFGQPEDDSKVIEIGNYLVRYNYMRGSGNDRYWTESGIKFLQAKGYYKYQTNMIDQPIVDKKVTKQELQVLSNIIGKQDLTVYSNESLIALTESPNSNIIQWASPLAENYGTVQKMVETGYHTPDVWKTILFQLVYSCAVLQKHDICFHKFSLENNFFIKDLFVNSEKRDHWVYKIGPFNFYVPNYGYLLMIDSKFVDIADTTMENLNNDDENIKYKINGKLYNKNNLNDQDRKRKILEDFRDIINPDSFRINLNKMNGEPPDDTIFDLLNRIYNDINNELINNPPNYNYQISNILQDHFRFLFNNRIGTLLTNDEKSILPVIPSRDFKKGDLVAYRERQGIFKWVLFIERTNDRVINMKIIDDINGNEKLVHPGQLYKFPESETIKQNTNNFINFDSNFTIETYNLNN